LPLVSVKVFNVSENVRLEWLAPLLCVREPLGLILGPETGYPEFLVVFAIPSRKMLL
jgi:hypothetical protein